MEKPSKTFGDFIKAKRLSQDPKVTLKSMASLLGLNLTYLSDVENNRKSAFSAEKIELFCKKLGISDDEKAEMYDLAARDNNTVSQDISDTIMYTEQGDLARIALRKVNQGKGNPEIWHELLRKMEGES